jgi:hypothetical protein
MKNRAAFCKPPLIRTHLKAYQFQRKSRLESIQLARRPDTPLPVTPARRMSRTSEYALGL